jgi:hypothetical protein
MGGGWRVTFGVTHVVIFYQSLDPFFFNFTTEQSNCLVLKFPSVRLQGHVVVLLVFVLKVSLFPSQKRAWQGEKKTVGGGWQGGGMKAGGMHRGGGWKLKGGWSFRLHTVPVVLGRLQPDQLSRGLPACVFQNPFEPGKRQFKSKLSSDKDTDFTTTLDFYNHFSHLRYHFWYCCRKDGDGNICSLSFWCEQSEFPAAAQHSTLK